MEMKDQGKSSTGMQANLAAMLSYLIGILTGIVFYLVEKESKFVRFHAMQSMLTFGALFVLNILLAFIPFINLIALPVIWFLGVALTIILMIKAYQGEMFKLPVVGDIAEKNS